MMDIFRRKGSPPKSAPHIEAEQTTERAESATSVVAEDVPPTSSPSEDVPRSVAPPPPSRRSVAPSIAGPRSVSNAPLPPPKNAPTPPPPQASYTPRPLPSVSPRVESSTRVDTLASRRLSTPSLTTRRAPESVGERHRDPLRLLHEREIEKLEVDHARDLERALQDKEIALAELQSSHLLEVERLQDQFRTDQAELQAEQVRRAQSMRRRISIAATLALEDRLGLLRHLESENDEFRARIVELERQIGLPISSFSTRPKMPSLPPEMFSSSSVPPPDPEPEPSELELAKHEVAEPSPSEPSPLVLEAPIFQENSSTPDDLTQLKGIGPAIARSLSKLGIRHLSQIAAWTDRDIESIAPQLRTQSSRIRKDGWVKSAQRLLAQRNTV